MKKSLKEYTKASILDNKEKLYSKIKEQKNFDEGCILIKLLNSLKAECDGLDNETISVDTAFKRADLICGIGKIIENYEKIQPLLHKYWTEEARKKKFERDL